VAFEQMKPLSGIVEPSDANDRFGEPHSTSQHDFPKQEVNLNALLNWLQSEKHDHASLTLYSVLSGNQVINTMEYASPDDVASFSHCSELLTAAPQWRKRLGEMKKVSKQWSVVVAHWNKVNLKSSSPHFTNKWPASAALLTTKQKLYVKEKSKINT
jgi:hypothetical protein